MPSLTSRSVSQSHARQSLAFSRSMPHKSNPQPCQPRIVSAKAQSCDSMCHDYRVAFCVAALATIAIAEPAAAIYIREEPANALSLPTWAIHISSVIEWITGMLLMWTFAEVTNRPYWKAMSWAMLPSLGSAACACTWHFFYNSPELEWLVALQAFLTVVGNFTLWMGAYHIFKKSQPAEAT